MENLLNGMTVLCQTDDCVYLRIPQALQVPSVFGGKCVCGHCDGTGAWDTLAVPTHGNYGFAHTVHMPVGSVSRFVESMNKAKAGSARMGRNL